MLTYIARLSGGVFGFPQDVAAVIGVDTLVGWLDVLEGRTRPACEGVARLREGH